jgi:hypothetical protein
VGGIFARHGPTAVLDQLRWRYPHVRIVRRDALASIRGDRDVIYAYREGRVFAAHV